MHVIYEVSRDRDIDNRKKIRELPSLSNGGKSISYVTLSIFLCVYFIILKT